MMRDADESFFADRWRFLLPRPILPLQSPIIASLAQSSDFFSFSFFFEKEFSSGFLVGKIFEVLIHI